MTSTRKSSPAALARGERNRRALRLRAAGLPYAQIATECEFPSEDSARTAVRRLLARDDRVGREEARGIARERLEALLRPLWVPAINPGMALQAARAAGHPDPPGQAKAVELVRRLLADLSVIEGTRSPLVLAGPTGGPLEGRLDVLHWVPDAAFMERYVKVLKDSGLVDTIEGQVVAIGPGADNSPISVAEQPSDTAPIDAVPEDEPDEPED